MDVFKKFALAQLQLEDARRMVQQAQDYLRASKHNYANAHAEMGKTLRQEGYHSPHDKITWDKLSEAEMEENGIAPSPNPNWSDL